MTAHRIVVIDIGIGNPDAICNLLRVSGRSAACSADPEIARRADLLILPGVGAFDPGVQFLRAHGLDEAIYEHSRVRGKPLVGICLGMQLLGLSSEEGDDPGLGLLPIRSCRIDGARLGVRVPNMGWRLVSPSVESGGDSLFEAGDRFYFAHTYAIAPVAGITIATSTHGQTLSAAVRQDNVIGLQFHPEKSHRFGRRLLNQILISHDL